MSSVSTYSSIASISLDDDFRIVGGGDGVLKGGANIVLESGEQLGCFVNVEMSGLRGDFGGIVGVNDDEQKMLIGPDYLEEVAHELQVAAEAKFGSLYALVKTEAPAYAISELRDLSDLYSDLASQLDDEPINSVADFESQLDTLIEAQDDSARSEYWIRGELAPYFSQGYSKFFRVTGYVSPEIRKYIETSAALMYEEFKVHVAD